MPEVRSITNPVINKISKAEYDAKVTAGVITETMIADEVWINQNVTMADQENLRNLKTVATTGSYNDLTDKPTIPDVNCSSIGAISTTEKGAVGGVAELGTDGKVPTSQLPTFVASESDPTVPAWAKATSKPTYTYAEITGKPALFSGSYNDLEDKPTLFSGSYNDLTNKPTIPSVAGLASETYVNNKVADLVNSAPTTLDTLGEVATAIQNNATVVEALNNSIGNKANASDVSALTTRVGTTESNITALQSGKADKSELFSGSYNDLTNKPTLSTCTLKIWG